MSGAESFEEAFGRAPEGVWAAPGRVNVIGEFTDYNDGFVLPIALPQRTRASVARRGDRLVRAVSADAGAGAEVLEADLDSLDPARASGWAAYVFGVCWSLAASGAELGGLDVHVASDVPVGAGLSSSAALECSVALALDELFGLGLDRARLAGLAQRAENDFVGVPCGIMDQSASLLCETGHALLLDTRSGGVRQLGFDLEASGLELLVIDTRVKHSLADSAYAERRRTCEQAARLLGVRALRDVGTEGLAEALGRLEDETMRRRVRHIVTEDARVLEVARLLEGSDPAAIGPVLSAGHVSLRDDYEVSAPELDVAVESALDAGALGARMTGGGFGGSAIALLERARSESVGEAVRAAFAAHGFGAPRLFSAVPSAGAERVG